MSISIEFLSQARQHSHYDWADISSGDTRIGKARCQRIDPTATTPATLVIYSINIYPEWAGHGYGREFVDDCKRHFDVIIADRVRPTAIGFWETLGFCDHQDGNWIYRKA